MHNKSVSKVQLTEQVEGWTALYFYLSAFKLTLGPSQPVAVPSNCDPECLKLLGNSAMHTNEVCV